MASDFEQKLQELPKPLLAALVLLVALVAFLFMQPLHSVCDTQKDNLKANLKGLMLPVKDKKKTFPAQITRAKDSCFEGNSSGACLEYFQILRRAMQLAKTSSLECMGSLMSIPIEAYAKMETYEKRQVNGVAQEDVAAVKRQNVPLELVVSEAIEIMARKAWGEYVPEAGADRLGWFREFEINTFCHLRDVYSQAKGHDAFLALRKKIFMKLPGTPRPSEEETLANAPSDSVKPVQLAVQRLTEQEIWERSLFSVNCDSYR